MGGSFFGSVAVLGIDSVGVTAATTVGGGAGAASAAVFGISATGAGSAGGGSVGAGAAGVTSAAGAAGACAPARALESRVARQPRQADRPARRVRVEGISRILGLIDVAPWKEEGRRSAGGARRQHVAGREVRPDVCDGFWSTSVARMFLVVRAVASCPASSPPG